MDEAGTIVYKGKPGPFGYHPEEVEAWLAETVSGRQRAAGAGLLNSFLRFQRYARIARLIASSA